MTIRLFEEPGEAAELPQQADVSIVARLLYAAWASIVAIVPALAATYSALQNPLTDIGAIVHGVRWVMKGGRVVVDKSKNTSSK